MKLTIAASHFPLALGTLLAAILSGCGGAGEEAVPPAVAADYDAISSYCAADKPDPSAPVRDGWITTSPYINSGLNNAATIVSPDGSSGAWADPILLKLALHDYRGVAGPLVPSGYLDSRWAMGALIPTVLPRQAVACTVQLSKLNYTTLPTIVAGRVQNVTTYSLAWKSYWDAVVPVDRLAGYAIDGFEFVSNFVPNEGLSFFVLDKARYASVAGLSICYRAPGGASWDCATPTNADLGYGWQLTRPGMKPGTYVLLSATPRTAQSSGPAIP
jgi:hypothetical protein